MKRIVKSRRGFALVEMVLVLAIIVIMATVLVISVGDYINKSANISNKADSLRTSTVGNIREEESRMNDLGFDRVSTMSSSTTS